MVAGIIGGPVHHITDTRRSYGSRPQRRLAVASIGQIAGPLTAGAIAQAAGLRAGLLILPALRPGRGGALPPPQAFDNV